MLFGFGYGYAAPFGWSVAGTTLSVIDAANPGNVARIALGSSATGGLAADPTGAVVYVATTDHLAVVDTRSRTVVASVPVAGASSLLMHPSGTYLYAAGRIATPGVPAQPLVAIVDTQVNQVSARLALPPASSVAGMAVLPDGSKVYVANALAGCCQGSVVVIDARLNSIASEIPLVVRGPVTADPTGRSVYAVSAGGVSIIDAATDALTATIAMSTEPFPPVAAAAIAFDPAGRRAYVAAYATGAGFVGFDGRVLAIDTTTQAIIATIPLNQAPTTLVVNPTGTRIYASGVLPGLSARPTQVFPAGVAVIDTTTRAVVATIPPVSPAPYIPGPGALVLNAATSALYAMDSSTLYVVDTLTNGMTAALPASTSVVFTPTAVAPPSPEYFYTLRSQTGAFTATQWGAPGDVAVPADYDGDGRTDIAVLRPREAGEEDLWYILRSSDGGVVRRQWGSVSRGDVPVPADYDGDRRTDFAIWRPMDGEWYILRSSDARVIYWRFGYSGDLPVPADYDGDGHADLATYSAGTWLIFGSTVGVTSLQLGLSTDVPVPGDYDGNGRADAAVWRPSTGDWRVLDSGNGTVRTVNLGAPGDIPVPADYDGDGRTDFAVFRPYSGLWLIRSSRTGEVSMNAWGASSDRPIPGDYDGNRQADISVFRP